jgi:DNA-binding response OmpR family regulator
LAQVSVDACLNFEVQVRTAVTISQQRETVMNYYGNGMPQPRKRILLIDRDPDTCEMMNYVLTSAGYDFACANTLKEGLSLAQTDSFDLILLDYHLPDGSGLELVGQIRHFDGKIPIFFYTGEAQEERIRKALEAEVQGYMIKPVEIEHVLQTLAFYLNA